MLFSKMGIIFDQKIFTSRIKFSKIIFFLIFFQKVALSSKASDYQKNFTGHAKRQRKLQKIVLDSTCVYTHLQLAYTSSVGDHMQPALRNVMLLGEDLSDYWLATFGFLK